VEVLVRITSGYYVYREPFRFTAEGATLGPAEFPAGQVKFDNNFQKNVETYRGDLRILLPLVQSGGPFKLQVVTQGCADAGLCYPPMSTDLRLDSAAVAGTGTLKAQPSGAGLQAPDGAIVDRMLRDGRLLPVLGLFFGLGLLLSLTPCVLPMLPILSSLILGTGQRPSRWRGLALAAAYSLGMALVYTSLGLAAGLAGEGLAAMLQAPWAIGAFAALLALFALSMFDVYELRLPASFTGHMSGQANRLPAGQFAGVFVMGGVSALIVSPCVTAPLAGALLFISQTGDVVLGGAALFAMATGEQMDSTGEQMDSQATMSLDGEDWQFLPGDDQQQRTEQDVDPGMSGNDNDSAVVRVPGPPPNPPFTVIELPRPPRRIRIGKWVYNLQQDSIV
jgi:thiol:disulfide interchange protein DsbD